MLTDVPLILQESVYKYELKIKDGVKEIEEEVKIDTEQNTETYRILQRDGNAGEVNILYDIKKVKKPLWSADIFSERACGFKSFLQSINCMRTLLLSKLSIAVSYSYFI